MPITWASSRSSSTQGRFVVWTRPSDTGPATPKPACAGMGRPSCAANAWQISPKPGYCRLSDRKPSRSSIESATAGPAASTSTIASSVLVPPASPAKTCMMRRNLRDGPGRSSDYKVAAGALWRLRCGRALSTVLPRDGGSWMRTAAWWAAAVLLVAAGAGRAQVEQYPGTAGTIIPIGETGWSATAGRTVGSGNSVLQAEAGWPGGSFTFLHGAAERTDWGRRINLTYKFL